MARQITNANSAAKPAARANSRANYPNNLSTNPAASQAKARPNELTHEGMENAARAAVGKDCNKTKDCP